MRSLDVAVEVVPLSRFAFRAEQNFQENVFKITRRSVAPVQRQDTNLEISFRLLPETYLSPYSCQIGDKNTANPRSIPENLIHREVRSSLGLDITR